MIICSLDNKRMLNS